MKLSAHQTLLPGAGLSERFLRAAECGLDGIELAFGRTARVYDLHAEIDKAMAASGLPVGSICGSYEGPIIHPDPAERESRLADLVRTLEFADAIGARGVIASAHLPSRFPARIVAAAPARSVALCRRRHADHAACCSPCWVQVVERTADGSAAVFLEPLNRYEAYYLNTVGKAANLCRAADHPRIQLMADMFHMNIEEADIPASLRAAAPHLGHVHLADSQRWLPGHGHTDFVSAFRALRKIDFEGWLALECMPTPGDALENMRACVRYLRGCWESATRTRTINIKCRGDRRSVSTRPLGRPHNAHFCKSHKENRMPIKAVFNEKHEAALLEYDDRPLASNEVRIQTEYASGKHGTTMYMMDGSQRQGQRWDDVNRLYLPSDEPDPDPVPASLVGTSGVGAIIEVGADVRDWIATGRSVIASSASWTSARPISSRWIVRPTSSGPASPSPRPG